MHTPQDATKLWCPMTRDRQLSEPCATNTMGRCIADKCAMWRWHPSVVLMPFTGALVMPGHGGDIPAKGYCGLAPHHFGAKP